MVATLYTKRKREKCRTGGSWRSSVYRVASSKDSHREQKYLNIDERFYESDKQETHLFSPVSFSGSKEAEMQSSSFELL
jgi:hypothetical protein